jgi:hypothetical protein
MLRKRRGLSYQKRVKDVNDIYDRQAKLGLSNREIWLRHIYPKYGISERTFYNLLNASLNPEKQIEAEELTLFDNEQFG